MRAVHAPHFAGAKPTSWRYGTVPGNERHTTGLLAELANLRTAFRWAADQSDLDTAAAIATLAGLLGVASENENLSPLDGPKSSSTLGLP